MSLTSYRAAPSRDMRWAACNTQFGNVKPFEQAFLLWAYVKTLFLKLFITTRIVAPF
jgi:hypothetical protein